MRGPHSGVQMPIETTPVDAQEDQRIVLQRCALILYEEPSPSTLLLTRFAAQRRIVI